MKTLFLLLASFFATLMMAQTVRFEPQWKKGDTYQLRITKTSTTIQEDETEETTEYLDPVISVMEVEKDSYKIRIRYKDILQKKLAELAEEHDWDVDPTDLDLIYRVSRKDGSYKLMNYKEAKKFMDKAFDDMAAGFASETDDEFKGAMVSLLLAPLKMMFESEETMSSYFAESLDEILLPFFEDLSTSGELETVETVENPFSPGDTLSATYYTSVSNYEPGSGKAEVKIRLILDFSAYLAALKPMMEGMMRGFAAMDSTASEAKIDSAMAEIDKAFGEMNMEGESVTTITFNPETGWPSLIVSRSDYVMNIGMMSNGRVEAVSTTEFERVK